MLLLPLTSSIDIVEPKQSTGKQQFRPFDDIGVRTCCLSVHFGTYTIHRVSATIPKMDTQTETVRTVTTINRNGIWALWLLFFSVSTNSTAKNIAQNVVELLHTYIFCTIEEKR
jgi:hypothetical protein